MSTARSGGPRQRVQGVDESRPLEDPLAVIRRVATVVVSVTNPIIAAGAFFTLVLFSKVGRLRRLRLRWIAVGTLVGLVVAVAVGLSRLYFQPWRDLFGLIAQGELLTLGSRLPEFISSHLVGWILAQLPFGLISGLALGLGLVALRRRWDAQWRYASEDAEKVSDSRAADKTLAKLPKWPQSKTVTRRNGLRVQLGAEVPSGAVYDRLTADDFLKHCYIDGPSGFGKSTDIVALLRALVAAPAATKLNIPAVIVTMKPAADLTAAVAEIARLAGRNFHVITQDGRNATTTYNPLRRGTPEEIRNRLIEAESNSADGGFSEPHYKRAGQRLTLFTARALLDLADNAVTYDRGRKTWRRDLPHLVRLMDPAELAKVLPDLSPAVASETEQYVAELESDKALVAEARGMRMRFAVTAEGSARSILPERDNGLDLEAALFNGDVVLMNLDAAADGDAARQIGNLALQDLNATLGRLGARRWHEGDTQRMAWICVDEFSALGGTALSDLFQRARGNGAGVALATQESAALDEYGEAFKASILVNSNVKVLHAQTYEAENHASTWGTKKGYQETHQLFEERDLVGTQTRASGQGSLREVDQFVVHPNMLRRLKPGEVYVAVTGQEPVRMKVKDYLSTLGAVPWPARVEEDAEDDSEAAEDCGPTAAPADEGSSTAEKQNPWLEQPVNPWLNVEPADRDAEGDPYDEDATEASDAAAGDDSEEWGEPVEEDMPDIR